MPKGKGDCRHSLLIPNVSEKILAFWVNYTSDYGWCL